MLCFVLMGTPLPMRAQQVVASIAFYNVENLFDAEKDAYAQDGDFAPGGRNGYTLSIYKKKLRNIADVLSRMGAGILPEGPALVGLAEVENKKVLSDLLQQEPLRHKKWKFLHYDAKDPRGIEVALLYDPARFKVLESRPLPMLPGPHGGNSLSRDILYVQGILLKDTVHVLVNHWPSRRQRSARAENNRMRAAAENRKQIDKLLAKSPRAKIVVMGDFNDNPTDLSIVRVLKAGHDKSTMASDGLYNPWYELFESGKGTSGFQRGWCLFDQILLSKSFVTEEGNGLAYKSASIFDPPFLKQPAGRDKGKPYRSFSSYKWTGGYSDHFPVILYLSRAR